MTKILLTASTLFVVCALPMAAQAQLSDQATISASAEIVSQSTALSLEVGSNLEFGQVLAPVTAGTLCNYYGNSQGGFEHTYFDGNDDQIVNTVCQFQSNDQTISEVAVNCSEGSGVIVSASYSSAGLLGLVFSDGAFPSRPYPASTVSDGTRVYLNQNSGAVCGTGGSFSIELGGQLSVSPDAALGQAQVGTIVIDASYL